MRARVWSRGVDNSRGRVFVLFALDIRELEAGYYAKEILGKLNARLWTFLRLKNTGVIKGLHNFV